MIRGRSSFHLWEESTTKGTSSLLSLRRRRRWNFFHLWEERKAHLLLISGKMDENDVFSYTWENWEDSLLLSYGKRRRWPSVHLWREEEDIALVFVSLRSGRTCCLLLLIYKKTKKREKKRWKIGWKVDERGLLISEKMKMVGHFFSTLRLFLTIPSFYSEIRRR